MKTRIILLVLYALGLGAFRQELTPQEVPVSAQQTLQRAFPQAAQIDWDRKSRKEYEVHFNVANVSHVALLNASGELLMYKKEGDLEKLPSLVKEAIEEKQKGARLEEVETIQHGEQAYYQVELRGVFSHLKLVYKADGLPEADFPYWD